jgi:hypothetical protein
VRFLPAKRRHRAAFYRAFLALSSLAAGMLAGSCASEARWSLLMVALGFAGYLLNGAGAVRLLFGPRIRRSASPFPAALESAPTRPRRATAAASRKPRAAAWPRAAGLALLFGLVAGTAGAQQTIFNVPSADVLDPGRVYLEVDELFRPTEPTFSATTMRGVFGVITRVEAGVNFGGFVAPGPVVPTATVAVKAQPIHAGDFAVTVGAFGLFYLRGSEDGDPAGQGYGHFSYRLPKLRTRIAVGGWYSSAGYAAPRSTGGALITLEQPLPCIEGLTLAADWWSGENAIGYVSPGFYYSTGHWTIYAAYTVKNGDSRGNGGLVELGYAF